MVVVVGKQAAVGLVILFAAACASPQPDVAPTTTPATSPSTAATSASQAAGTTITTGPSDYGTMLYNADDQAIYMFELETSSTPVCYDECEEAWPPVLTTDAPAAAGEVDPALLGTTPRRDGTTQVTYNDHPLYYYVNEGPGEVLCHNVRLNGGWWWVVQPDGNRAP